MQQPRAKAAKKHVILFLAANPHDTGRLALDAEAHAIHDELKRSGYRERFELVTRWAAEPMDLLRELRGLKPTVVHFSGHGAQRGGTKPGGVVVNGAKSSLVTAGVLPRLTRGVTGLGTFVVRELRPSEQPAARLRQALEVSAGQDLVVADRVAALLAPHAPSVSLLLVVDQLEELFTLANADERARFLDALRALRTERRCVVLFMLRADFFGELMESALWAERRGQLSRVEVSPLRDEALREAIAAPARAVGVTVEPELIERLVADAASEPGILPLLQETLVHLWDAHTDPPLTLAGYEALGDGERSGLAVALARRADAAMPSSSCGSLRAAHFYGALSAAAAARSRSAARAEGPRSSQNSSSSKRKNASFDSSMSAMP